MRKLTVVIAILTSSSLYLKAQNCPTASFTIPDSICGGNPLNIINTSSGGTAPLSYNWDFCAGDLKQNPVYDTIGDFGNFAQSTNGIDFAYDNGNWYGFALNSGGQSITRYDFGNSLLNSPTPFDLGQIGGTQTLQDIQIIKDNNQWYAFVCTFQDGIIRVDFGINITNPTPTNTNLTIPGGILAIPTVMKLVKDHGNFKLLISSNSINVISLINIGNNITNNTPTGSLITGNFHYSWGLSVVRDCDRWYAFVSNPYNSNVYVVDFGDSISTSPASVTDLNVQSFTTTSRGISVINDGGKWYAFPLSSGGTLKRINLGNPINSVNPTVDNLGITFEPEEHFFSIKKSGSTWVGITTYSYTSSLPDLRKFVFPDNCSANTLLSSDPNPIGISYNSVGYYQVALQVTDANGNTAFYSDSVYSKLSPVTSFVHTNVCDGSAVDFIDSTYISAGSITSWSWDFGDSNTSNLQNPSHLYSSPGNYVVVLQTNSSVGCGSSFIDTISIGAIPVAALSFVDNLCAEIPILFTDLSTSLDTVATWAWDFGDSTVSGQTNPTHIYNIGGTYFVSLTLTTNFGCSASASDSIHIRPRPVSDFIVGNTCIGETVTYGNLSTISDGSILNYSWDLDDNTLTTNISPTHQYPALVAVYDVTLIAFSPNGCSDTLSTQVRIGTPPNPAFSYNPDTICKGSIILFSDLSTVTAGGPGDTINTWNWNFGDSFSSNQQNPSHAYADTGTYFATLIVTTPTSCDSSITKIIHVTDVPTAAYNYTDVCFGDPITFTDFSSAAAGSVINSWSWDFGDSTSGSGTSIIHTYTQPGTYNVVLTVTDNFGCNNFSLHQVSAYPIPVASFTNTIVCTGTTAYFTNTSTIGNGDVIQNYFWDFGDGSTSTDKDPTHTYSIFGSKTVMLIATSSHGCIDTLYQVIFVNKSPNPGFTYSTTCLGQVTQFTYVANPFPSTISTFNWTFGDLGTSTLEDPSHNYSTANVYNVTVSVVDNTGCPASLTLPVSVNPIPLANFSYSSGCTGIGTSFSDSSTLNTGTITNFLWNFGGGNVSALQAPVFVFDTAGIYPIQLKIISAAGCADSISKIVTIVEMPVAAFTMNATSGAPPFSAIFNNLSTGAINYLWDFGDGNTSSINNPTQVYNDSGSFTISLVASNQKGCSDTAYKTVYVLVPYIDLAVLNVNTNTQNGLLFVSADLFNLGNNTIDNFEIIAQLEGGTIVHENYNNPMPPGFLKYDFNSKIETNKYTNPSYVCVEAINPNGLPDEVQSNNKKCSGNNNTFELIDIFNNPATQQAIINFNIPVEEDINILFHDVTGKRITDDILIKGNKGFNTYIFDTRTLTKGIYSCVIRYREETIAKRFCKF